MFVFTWMKEIQRLYSSSRSVMSSTTGVSQEFCSRYSQSILKNKYNKNNKQTILLDLDKELDSLKKSSLTPAEKSLEKVLRQVLPATDLRPEQGMIRQYAPNRALDYSSLVLSE